MNEPLYKEECAYSCSCPANDSRLLVSLLKLHTSHAIIAVQLLTSAKTLLARQTMRVNRMTCRDLTELWSDVPHLVSQSGQDRVKVGVLGLSTNNHALACMPTSTLSNTV